jgi:hypothetical protein
VPREITQDARFAARFAGAGSPSLAAVANAAEPAGGLCLPRRDPAEGSLPPNQGGETATSWLTEAQPGADELSPLVVELALAGR